MEQENMIQNEKTQIPKTSEMNDCDYLNDVLESVRE